MGREAVCTARVGGKPVAGKALLETKELLFRSSGGDVRLRVPFAEMKDLRVVGPALALSYRGEAVSFDLGAEAAVWADKIKNPPSRLTKLGVKPGLRVAIAGPVEAAFVAEARAAGAEVSTGKPKDADLVFYAVEKKADLARMAALASGLQPAGALWIVRRKGSGAPVTEAESMAAGKAAGLVDTKVVAFSETHTAERYVIPVAARARR
jgi:hypothetical protein